MTIDRPDWKRRCIRSVAWAAAASSLLGPSCLSRNNTPFQRQTDDDAGGPPLITLDSGLDARDELPPPLPHAVLGIDPPHGPFAGGTLALIRGNGFTSAARVWLGEAEVDPSTVVAIDPQRIQISVPKGPSGPVDVRVQNGDDVSTESALIGGYTYDSFYAEPGSGPTSGGTLITIKGDGTAWDTDTTVSIDLKPCEVIDRIDTNQLVCQTPPGTPGSKPLRVTTGDGISVDVLDAFIYGNSDNGFRGGLSGATLSANLKVLAFDALSGLALGGVTVVVGDDLATAAITETDANGVALFEAPELGPTQSVTLARKCYEPITFVNVPVETVTAYLNPVLSPACGAQGDLPPSGGSFTSNASVTGEVVWPATGEFRRAGWTDVPTPVPGSSERLVAYVMQLSSDPSLRFTLPSASEAVTPAADGDRGFGFSASASPGNFALYALAGIEDRTKNPPTFTAYSLGLVQGVAAPPGSRKSDVFIPIDVRLDHALTLELVPPEVTPRGPDRVLGSVAVRVGSQGFLLLPNGTQTRFLPSSAPLDFIGVPALTGSLVGTDYVLTARAVTGSAGGTPLSALGLFSTTNNSSPLTLDQFVQVPQLLQPVPNAVWNGRDLGSTLAAGGSATDIVVYEIQSGGGLVGWRIVTPGSVTQFHVPDLAALSSDLALVHGPLTITVSAARIDDFAYGALRYRDLTQRRWSAYATDVFFASY